MLFRRQMYTYSNMHKYIHDCMYICMYKCIYTCIYIHMYLFIYIHIYTYIYTYIYVDAHTLPSIHCTRTQSKPSHFTGASKSMAEIKEELEETATRETAQLDEIQKLSAQITELRTATDQHDQIFEGMRPCVCVFRTRARARERECVRR
jgi:hypothetical protein